MAQRSMADTASHPEITRLTGPLLGLVRVVIGYLWWQETLWKRPPSFGCKDNEAAGLCDWIGREIQNPQYGFYATFLKNVIQPNIGLFGWFIYFGELVTAILLVFGILTRLGGLLGFVQGVNLWIGLAAVPHEWQWSYIMLALINLTFTLTAAGRWLGADALIHPRAVAAAARGNRIGRIVALLT